MKKLIIAISILVSTFTVNATDLKDKVQNDVIKVTTNESATLESTTLLLHVEQLNDILNTIDTHFDVTFEAEYGNESNTVLKASKEGKSYTMRIVQSHDITKVIVIAAK